MKEADAFVDELTQPLSTIFPEVAGIRRNALTAGGASLMLSAIGWFFNPVQFYRSYLIAAIFWLGVGLGCLSILMVQYLSGGAWGLVIRRLLEAGAGTLRVVPALFVPLVFGIHQLYTWSRAEEVKHSEVLQQKTAYLNLPFFSLRALIYFAAWFVLAHLFQNWSLEQDRTADRAILRRLQLFSGPGLVLIALTVTFASVDWIMSLDPKWFSTIFGLLLAATQALSAFAFVVALCVWLHRRGPLAMLSAEHFQDFGKLLLAFVMVWAYLGFSQFLVIWSGNLPEEIPWYLRRLHGGWNWMALLLVVFQFVLPFLVLLSRDLKRNPRLLGLVAGWVFLMSFVHLFWMIAPEFHHQGFYLHWMDVTTLAGVGGLWFGYFLTQLGRAPLLPIHDPYLAEALSHGASHA
ncbi:MAG TPA: hypothetical protein VGK99_00540 [Acidobacteriota bacterium]|jgi:hypothetical protein